MKLPVSDIKNWQNVKFHAKACGVICWVTLTLKGHLIWPSKPSLVVSMKGSPQSAKLNNDLTYFGSRSNSNHLKIGYFEIDILCLLVFFGKTHIFFINQEVPYFSYTMDYILVHIILFYCDEYYYRNFTLSSHFCFQQYERVYRRKPIQNNVVGCQGNHTESTRDNGSSSAYWAYR